MKIAIGCDHAGINLKPTLIEYLEKNGYVNDMNAARLHHEIYLSDARKVAPEKSKTVIRHPIKKA